MEGTEPAESAESVEAAEVAELRELTTTPDTTTRALHSNSPARTIENTTPIGMLVQD